MAARIELDEEDRYDRGHMYYDMLNAEEKARLYHNIAGSLGKCEEQIIKEL